ncbi:EamA family transporter [Clostridium tarantellae]|uniref:EamA family transporter n=1 Tax=Clostridium tarantellae TaxID=39493 RepID=A0A6I1MKB3_9CLOT|nr:EamA family transporter [Clostridium tarantellae]MPQ42587.1 EamA family transporter [Clostridium tarantellae]
MNSNLLKGVGLIIMSALCTSFGQLFWKIGVNNQNKKVLLISLFLGFVLYGIGAISMIIALKFGELSVLHPIMCVGYIFALLNGKIFLKEQITIVQFLGVIIIILGVIFITRGGKNA